MDSNYWLENKSQSQIGISYSRLEKRFQLGIGKSNQANHKQEYPNKDWKKDSSQVQESPTRNWKINIKQRQESPIRDRKINSYQRQDSGMAEEEEEEEEKTNL